MSDDDLRIKVAEYEKYYGHLPNVLMVTREQLISLWEDRQPLLPNGAFKPMPDTIIGLRLIIGDSMKLGHLIAFDVI